jgi:hypothetical protein
VATGHGGLTWRPGDCVRGVRDEPHATRGSRSAPDRTGASDASLIRSPRRLGAVIRSRPATSASEQSTWVGPTRVDYAIAGGSALSQPRW